MIWGSPEDGIRCQGLQCHCVADRVVLDRKGEPRACCGTCATMRDFTGECLTVEQCDDGLLRAWLETEKRLQAKARKEIREAEEAVKASEARMRKVGVCLQRQPVLL